MSKSNATAIGFLAILMWAFLAILTAACGSIPPFQLAAMTFLIGGLVGASRWIFQPQSIQNLKQDWRVWLLGTCGLCIYHCLYFFALQNAPAVEASLIAYLWPLLIVVFAALLPGEHLRLHHGVGAVLGLLGAILIITKGFTVGFSSGLKLGHLMALACAFIWSGYSVLSRRFKVVPTDIVLGYCFITALVALVLHLVLEVTIWPASPVQWTSVFALGLFPVGLAFYAWDIGIKNGDIMVLGAASYAAPLLSTFVLVLGGMAQASWAIALACILITVGAVIAAKDMIFKTNP